MNPEVSEITANSKLLWKVKFSTTSDKFLKHFTRVTQVGKKLINDPQCGQM